MVLHELHPGHADHDFTLHTQVQIDNGTARTGDVVLLARDGNRELGELLLSFSVQGLEASESYSVLGLWRAMSLADGEGEQWRATQLADGALSCGGFCHCGEAFCVAVCLHTQAFAGPLASCCVPFL